MLATKTNTKEKSVTSSKPESKKGVVEETAPQIQLNSLWHGLATHVGNNAAGPGDPSPIQRKPSHPTSVPHIQRMCAECGDEELNTDAETPIQTKLTVGAPDDPYEKEADAVADKVMRIPVGGGQDQLQVDATSIQSKPFKTPLIQRLCTECTEELDGGGAPSVQNKSDGKPAQPAVPGSVSTTIKSPGSGSPLNKFIRSRVEPVLGADLSNVRVYEGMAAQDASHSLNAKAFTHQNNIFLGAGQSATDTELMAHEATHTVQQTSASNNQSTSSAELPRALATPKTDELLQLESAGLRVDGKYVIKTPEGGNLLLRVHPNPATTVDGLPNTVGNIASGTEVTIKEARAYNWYVVEGEAHWNCTAPNKCASHGLRVGFVQEKYLKPIVVEPDIPEGAYDEEGQQCISEVECEVAGQEKRLEFGTKIGEFGIAYKKEGVNLRDEPASNPRSTVLTRLPLNTRMYVDSVRDDHYFIATDQGQFGYVATTHVKTNLPEPNAKIYHIEQGDTALGISRKHYGGEAKWGKDHRFFTNALVYVNRGTGKRGIYKPDPDADWDTTQVRADFMIWVPGLAFLNSLQGVVKSGSISHEAWQTVKEAAAVIADFLLGTAAFVAGLLHGALESVWDILVGLKDLIVMVWDLLKWLIGLITGDSKGLFESLEGINWGELVQGWLDDFDAKWNHDNPLKKWHFRGWVIGYAIAEIVMLFMSGGIIQGIKWVGKSAKVAKVIATLPKLAKLGEAAKTSKAGQKVIKALKATKGAGTVAKEAQEWVVKALKFPADRLADLTLDAIEKLKTIPEWAQKAIGAMSRADKLSILGCNSPCKVALRAIWRRLESVVDIRGGVLVRGFRNAGELLERIGNLRNRLLKAGLDDVVIGLRGSSVTGVSSKGGAFRWLPSEAAKVSDVDFFFTSVALERKLVAAGAKFKPGGYLPFKELQKYAPEVAETVKEFGAATTKQLGRKGDALLLKKATVEGLEQSERIIF